MSARFFTRRNPTNRELLEYIKRKVDRLMTTVEEVQAALSTLTTDLQTDAAAALAEFSKLEAEIAEKAPEVDLTPLKESIETLDTKVKTAKESIPTE